MAGAQTYTTGMNAAEQKLFALGDDTPPSALAGREQEQAALSTHDRGRGKSSAPIVR